MRECNCINVCLPVLYSFFSLSRYFIFAFPHSRSFFWNSSSLALFVLYIIIFSFLCINFYDRKIHLRSSIDWKPRMLCNVHRHRRRRTHTWIRLHKNYDCRSMIYWWVFVYAQNNSKPVISDNGTIYPIFDRKTQMLYVRLNGNPLFLHLYLPCLCCLFCFLSLTFSPSLFLALLVPFIHLFDA